MNIVEIPIASAAPHFVQENEIFGHAYHLEFQWIESVGFWMLHVADGGGRPLALGIKLQSDWPLYIRHQIDRPFTIMLLARSPGQALLRQNLNRHFLLVAYETL